MEKVENGEETTEKELVGGGGGGENGVAGAAMGWSLVGIIIITMPGVWLGSIIIPGGGTDEAVAAEGAMLCGTYPFPSTRVLPMVHDVVPPPAPTHSMGEDGIDSGMPRGGYVEDDGTCGGEEGEELGVRDGYTNTEVGIPSPCGAVT